MAEIITLAAVDPPKTVFRIALIAFDWANAHVKIHVREWDGSAFGERTIIAQYTGAVATAMMTQLNKVNLSTAGNSLHQRVIARLLADGKLPAGNASGSPD
ncbi:MAG: hypothetical protein Q8O42_09500 [Acidobacteriota bacterium]|nr:hypothetical protein [Acidobacteriota bacterium]